MQAPRLQAANTRRPLGVPRALQDRRGEAAQHRTARAARRNERATEGRGWPGDAHLTRGDRQWG
jgi:hypothetical protein